MRCRHTKSWFLESVWQWCPQCGSLRRLEWIAGRGHVPETGWQKPVGQRAKVPTKLPKLRKVTA